MEEGVFDLLLMFSEVAKTAFYDRLSLVRDLLSPPGRPKHENLGLMTASLDLNALNPSAGTHNYQCSTDWKLLPLSGT